MLETIIRTAVQRADTAGSAEEYLIRLRANIESSIRHQIKLHGGRLNFNVNTRFHLGYDDVDGFYQEIVTNVVCSGNAKELVERVRLTVLPNTVLSGLRGIFHHVSLKVKETSAIYLFNDNIHDTKTALQQELQSFFGNHTAIVVLNHSRTGNCAVDVELIQDSLKGYAKMCEALERGLSDDFLIA